MPHVGQFNLVPAKGGVEGAPSFDRGHFVLARQDAQGGAGDLRGRLCAARVGVAGSEVGVQGAGRVGRHQPRPVVHVGGPGQGMVVAVRRGAVAPIHHAGDGFGFFVFRKAQQVVIDGDGKGGGDEAGRGDAGGVAAGKVQAAPAPLGCGRRYGPWQYPRRP